MAHRTSQTVTNGRALATSGTNADGHLQRNLSSEMKGSVLSCHSVCYDVSVKKEGCCAGVQPKRILQNIDAIFKPGMNAIMGPTGGGKSSLLDVLAGRKDPKGLQGELLIDGCLPPENFKCRVGYVVQDDVVMGTLTVRENFQFSASLRLSGSVSRKERNDRVDQVILELGLSSCADTKVGNEFIRGVSGGERKRCNIGMELIIEPPVLFLDEPTTGLDASTANAVMLLLYRLSQKGRTIVFSIHQPRFAIYRLFDSIILLSMGQTVYHGPCNKALGYFDSLGYKCEEHNNPPDFFLDVINGDSTCVSGPFANMKQESDLVAVAIEGPDFTADCTVGQKLAESYKKSTFFADLMAELTPIKADYEKRVKDKTLVLKPPVQYATSFGRQFVVLCGRTIKNIIRNPQTTISTLVVSVVFAIIVGVVYYQISDIKKDGIQNRVGAFFFIVMNQVFTNLSGVELFIKERAIFIHENVSGFYRVSAFFLSKLLCDIIPMRLSPVIIFSVIAYFMIGLRMGADYFFFFLLNLFLTTLTAAALAILLSASVRIFAVANLLLALIYVFMMLYSGLLVNLSTIAVWLRWIRYLSIFRYSLNALYINEMKDEAYCAPGNTTDCDFGNFYLQSQDIKYDTDWDLWVNELALFLITCGFLFLAYVQLRRLNKLR